MENIFASRLISLTPIEVADSLIRPLARFTLSLRIFGLGIGQLCWLKQPETSYITTS